MRDWLRRGRPFALEAAARDSVAHATVRLLPDSFC